MTGGTGEAEITAEMVQQALANLYSPGELARCALAEALPASRKVEELLTRGQWLRGVLLDAIEQLRPLSRMAGPAQSARAYDCLSSRYVSGMTIDEVAEEMSLSPRQVYRDLRWAEARLAELLSYQRQRDMAALREADDPLAREIGRVERRLEQVDLDDAVRTALATVAPLAERRGVRILCRRERRPLVALGTPGLLQQLVVQVVSALAQSLSDRTIALRLEAERVFAVLHVPLDEAAASVDSPLLRGALRIGESQGVAAEFVTEGGRSELRLRFALVKQRRVLIVEDYDGAYALYQRYLEDSEWVPVLAGDPTRVPEIASAEGAEAVILDLMMPQVSGWTVLQMLRHDAATKDVPVIICSVVSDPELGLALGASAYLTKPVSRQMLLEALTTAAGSRTTGSGWPGST